MDSNPRYIKLHHSFPGDWICKILPTWDDAWAQLHTDRFITPPSSLKLKTLLDPRNHTAAIPTIAQAANLRQGRVISWLAADTAFGSKMHIYLGIKSDNSVTITSHMYTHGVPWVKWRFSWWNTFDYTNAAKLALRIEWLDGDDWTVDWEQFYDRLTGSDNRIGLGGDLSTYNHLLFDETEIWTPL